MNRKWSLASGIIIVVGLVSWILLQAYNNQAVRSTAPVRLDQTNSMFGRPNLPVRLAILNFDPSRQAQQPDSLTDLLTAELSTRTQFHLVERQSIEKILSEISLTLTQKMAPPDLITAGRLLRADWFLTGSHFVQQTTNYVIAKIVDATTGVILDITTMTFDQRNPFSAANQTAAFVSNAATNGATLADRTFIGIGGFVDLSVNDRYPNFTKEIRRSLEQAYQSSGIHVVERGTISPLLRELRFNLGALTGEQPKRTFARPAVFLVDGYFQSYQDERAKVSLALRIQRVGMREQLFPFTEPMGNPLLEKVVAAINQFVATNRPGPLSRERPRQEAKLQLERGKERSELPYRLAQDFLVGGAAYYREPEKRRRNITEAIEAFEATLFLDPACDEAKLYLGVCLKDPSIGRIDEARDYLREVIDTCTNQSWVASAQNALDSTFPKPPPAPLSQAEKIKGQTDAWFDKCKFTVNSKQGGIRTNPWDLTDNTYTVFLRVFNFDQEATRKYLEAVLAEIDARYPMLAPYFAGSFTRWARNDSPTQLEKWKKALDWWEQNPDKLPDRVGFYRGVAFRDIDWCLTARHFDLARRIVDLIEKFDGVRLKDQDRIDLDVRKGALLIALEKWDEALNLFENLQRSHGNQLDISKQLETCREKLRLQSPAEPPTEFRLGRAVRLFVDGPVLKHDGTQFWVAEDDRLYDYADGAWLRIPTPPELSAITAIAANRAKLWCGTSDSGLFELDRPTGKWHHLSEADGLLTPSIASLWAADDKLWIGFGSLSTERGGLGYLNLATEQFVGMTPELGVSGTRLITDTERQPPKGPVVALHQSGTNFLLVAVTGKGVQRFDLTLKAWSTANSWQSFDGKYVSAISDGNNHVTSMSLSEDYLAVGCSRGGGHSGGQKYWGDLSIHSLKENRWTVVADRQGLPNGDVYSVAIDGNHLWAGGTGFLVVIDLATTRILKICTMGKFRVHAIEVAPDAVWIAAGNQLFRQNREGR